MGDEPGNAAGDAGLLCGVQRNAFLQVCGKQVCDHPPAGAPVVNFSMYGEVIPMVDTISAQRNAFLQVCGKQVCDHPPAGAPVVNFSMYGEVIPMVDTIVFLGMPFFAHGLDPHAHIDQMLDCAERSYQCFGTWEQTGKASLVQSRFSFTVPSSGHSWNLVLGSSRRQQSLTLWILQKSIPAKHFLGPPANDNSRPSSPEWSPDVLFLC
ncbi:hypothetical protein BJ742DRAFT_776193 [Cladochytrium replicatum]|nr:hypothetical protein BJ742DRAFT_776193 [Cladochytrium replicatum]